jgi:hypothetical protein
MRDRDPSVTHLAIKYRSIAKMLDWQGAVVGNQNGMKQ